MNASTLHFSAIRSVIQLLRPVLGMLALLAFASTTWAQTAPTITSVSSPRQVVTLGQNLTLSVTASGTPTPTYQWKRNGRPIPGATAATYAITNAVTWRDNGWYQAVATNSAGSATSAVVFVNVAVNPAQVAVWGNNIYGQTIPPAGLSNVIGLAANNTHMVAVKADGTVVAWGDNHYGQTTVPAGLSDVVGVAAGGYHTVALKADGTVVAWGLGGQNQTTVPGGLRDVVSVAAGGYHTVALKADGTVVAWGENGDGETMVPAGLSSVVGIASYHLHTVALKADGTVVAWGYNLDGQTTVPAGLNNVVSVAASASQSVALKADGTVLSWGSNDYIEKRVPVGLNSVVSIACGIYQVYALKADSTVVAWGMLYADDGQTTVPAGLNNVVGLALGARISAVLRNASGDLAPTITRHPNAQFANYGQSVTFSVSANVGPPTAYQWRKDGVTISGATSATYTIVGAALSDAGSYNVVVSNYLGTATSNAATLTVAPAQLTVTATNITKVYGADVPTLTPTITGFVNGETLATSGVTGTPALTTLATNTSSAGTYQIIAANGSLAAANYTFTFLPGTLTVTKAPLTVTADNKSRVYGTVNPTLTATITGFVNGEALASSGVSGAPALITPATTTSSVGNYPILASLGALASTNYSFTFTNGTLAISAAANGVTLDNLAQTYDGAPKAVTVITNPPGIAVAVTYNNSINVPVNSGSYAVVATLTGKNFSGSASGTLVIAKASPTIVFSALPSPIMVGVPFSVVAVSSSGLNPVLLSIVNGNATLNSTALILNDSNPVTIRATQAGNENYNAATAELTVSTGKLGQTISFAALSDRSATVSPQALTATASSGLPVAFDLVSGPATLNGNTLTLTGAAGTVVVRATQPGNSAYNAAAPVERSFVVSVEASAPTITSQPLPQTALVGGSATFLVGAAGNPTPTFLWRKNGVPITNAAGATLVISNVQAADAGAYDVVVSNAVGTVTSSLARLTVATAVSAPAITRQPGNITTVVGRDAMFSVAAAGAPDPVYQWRKDGLSIAGATGAVLTLSSVKATQAGTYSVVISNIAGSVTSNNAGLVVLRRSYAGDYFGTFGNGTFAIHINDDNTGIFLGYVAGARIAYVSLAVTVDDNGHFRFTTTTNGTSSPSNTGPISTDRTVSADASDLVFDGTISELGVLTGSSSNGISLNGTASVGASVATSSTGFYQATAAGTSAQTLAIVGASGQVFMITQAGTTVDAASGVVDGNGKMITTSVAQKTVTVNLSTSTAGFSSVVSGANGQTTTFDGFEKNSTASANQRLINISSRMSIGTGDQGGTVGFVIGGLESKTVLIRAVGPTLRFFGISNALAAPRLELMRGSTLITTNQGWLNSGNSAELPAAAVRAGAFPLGATAADSAILTTLTPGLYTAIVTASDGQPGVGLVEVYDLSSESSAQKLVNISSRAFAGTDASLLVAGVVISGTVPKRVLIRAVGPTLTQFGVVGALAQPQLKLFSSQGAVIAENIGWGSSVDAAAIAEAATRVGAFTFPQGSADSAMIINLQPGLYTAQVSGVGGTTGNALVEVYEIP